MTVFKRGEKLPAETPRPLPVSQRRATLYRLGKLAYGLADGRTL